ncbi:MAG: AsmA-like C-terminal domain-containing protein [Desulforhopalus sp.]|nr:AsmA-like C-terminal domain-containing protein [Desulforhopalus sp.]
MTEADQQKKQRPAPTRIRRWLVGGIVTLVLLPAVATLIVPRFIDSGSVKRKIQAAVTEQTGGQVDYQGLGFAFFPRPAIELRQASLSIPGMAEGMVAALRIAPKLASLLTGDLQLARLELDSPQINLQLPGKKPEDTPAQPDASAKPGKSLSLAIAPLVRAIAGLELQVNNAQLGIARSEQKLIDIKGLNLRSGLSMTALDSARASLQLNLDELSIFVNDRQETVKGLTVNGSVEIAGDTRAKVQLDRLALTEPALELTGDLAMAPPATPAITLNLSGSNLDVDAIRKTALALAGDTTPIKQIFDYLRGGKVSRISFTSHGKSPSDLGKLNNIVIKGQLQEGKISIPRIDLHLTEVFGEVVISQGILQGTGLSARLDQSTGRDGSLQIGLTRDNDLFQLQLMVRADLAQTQGILQRLVRAPAFTAELVKITKLQGTAHGKLTLGDSLHAIGAKVEVSEVTLSADYQRVPLPITIAGGRITFEKQMLGLDNLSGSLGQSQFADLSCRFLWEKDLFLNIDSGRFDLAMAEFFPWLASQEGLRDKLQKVTQVTGLVAISAIDFQGEVARPSGWQYAATGMVKDLLVDTTLLPNSTTLASGGFAIDRQKLTLEKIKTLSGDAALTLSGSIHGFPQRLGRIDLSLDGSMGPQSVEWLSDTLKVPKAYAIHAPLSINKAQLAWQANATTSFRGLISIDKGPAIDADVEYQPGQLQVNRLHIKDQYSDATLVFAVNEAQHDYRFIGNLQHETLQTLFVDPQSGSGRLAGDFAVTVPQSGDSKATTKGQLIGERLPIILPSRDFAYLEEMSLNADGSQVKVDISRLTWKNLIWEPVNGTVSFQHDRVDIGINEAKMCGINSLGQFSFAGDEYSLDQTLTGKDLDVATSYACLTEGRVKATGRLDFSSRVTAKGKRAELVKNLKGPLQITLRNGVIEQDKFVARILEVLNVTEIVKGRLPDLSTTGFAYRTMTLQGEFKNGKLQVQKYFMDGETLNLIGKGEIDLAEKTLEIQLLAAPFKTVDTIIKYLPGVNYLLGGSLIAIPISITGTLDDPQVTIMSVSAVGSSLYDLAKRTITSPFKLLETINPWAKQNGK